MTSSEEYIVFHPGYESGNLENLGKDTPLDILRMISKMSKWRSLWHPLYIPRWPPVKSKSFFIPDMSQATWKTLKMIPHLTMLRIISKMSKWRSLWPPLFIPRWPPVKSTWFFIPDMSQAAWKTRKRHPTCLHCSIFREMVFEKIIIYQDIFH